LFVYAIVSTIVYLQNIAKHNCMKKLVLLCSAAALLLFDDAIAQVRLPAIFGDHMVLQRNAPIPVWGWAQPKEKITVQFNGQKLLTTANDKGQWKLSLNPVKEGGPYTLQVSGKNSITLNDILVGEVWVCSGQSNMEWTVSNSNDADKEIAAADYPMIRHIKVKQDLSSKPLEDLRMQASWEISSPATTGNFTAVGYFFARRLYNELKVPIGLINTTWGGTDVESWTSQEAVTRSSVYAGVFPSSGINLDSIMAEKEKKAAEKLAPYKTERLQISSASALSSPGYKDAAWPEIMLPALWEQSIEDFDGTVWFRKTVELSAAEASGNATLSLSRIDDSDKTFVNGIEVGGMVNSYDKDRTYSLPQGVLKEGINVILVRVEDNGGGGGIYGKAEDLKLQTSAGARSLAGPWRMMIENISGSPGSLGPNSYPSLLFNAMVKPLIPFGIKGVIWYQGENNAGRAYQYRKTFPLMITDWRKHWKQGDFPFLFVQLASFGANKGDSRKGSTWAELREAQSMTLSLPNTGMAVTTDIGQTDDIHPRNKQDVGSRLAAIALNMYGKKAVASGPVYKSMEVKGNKVIVSFDHIEKGLISKGEIAGFEIAGEDKIFHPATALIKNDKVVLTSSSVDNPVAIRYAWADDAGYVNLFNSAGLPAAPFRTDKWKGITESAKYSIR
jgi:sialate O-acetylesterase